MFPFESETFAWAFSLCCKFISYTSYRTILYTEERILNMRNEHSNDISLSLLIFSAKNEEGKLLSPLCNCAGINKDSMQRFISYSPIICAYENISSNLSVFSEKSFYIFSIQIVTHIYKITLTQFATHDIANMLLKL